MTIPEHKRVVLLDMNSTFMFGEDRFGEAQDYFAHYQRLGGTLDRPAVNGAIESAYRYLDARYPDPKYHEAFPTVMEALRATLTIDLDSAELDRLVDTFAAHEIGTVSGAYIDAIRQLAARYVLGTVVDIWSPKTAWQRLFESNGLAALFTAQSFSSDHGIVKPSPIPFTRVLNELGVRAADAVFVGDSVRRDLGGASAAGIDCILVGGAQDGRALASVANLLELIDAPE